jgi:hypothetical protein
MSRGSIKNLRRVIGGWLDRLLLGLKTREPADTNGCPAHVSDRGDERLSWTTDPWPICDWNPETTTTMLIEKRPSVSPKFRRRMAALRTCGDFRRMPNDPSSATPGQGT